MILLPLRDCKVLINIGSSTSYTSMLYADNYDKLDNMQETFWQKKTCKKLLYKKKKHLSLHRKVIDHVKFIGKTFGSRENPIQRIVKDISSSVWLFFFFFEKRLSIIL